MDSGRKSRVLMGLSAGTEFEWVADAALYQSFSAERNFSLGGTCKRVTCPFDFFQILLLSLAIANDRFWPDFQNGLKDGHTRILALLRAAKRKSKIKAEEIVHYSSRSSRGLLPESLMLLRTVEQVRRLSRIAGGFTLLLIGIVMLVTPGPGWLVILLGLGLLAAEFVWARRLMDRIKREGERMRSVVWPYAKNTSAKDSGESNETAET
jgi:hypothetical protein